MGLGLVAPLAVCVSVGVSDPLGAVTCEPVTDAVTGIDGVGDNEVVCDCVAVCVALRESVWLPLCVVVGVDVSSLVCEVEAVSVCDADCVVLIVAVMESVGILLLLWLRVAAVVGVPDPVGVGDCDRVPDALSEVFLLGLRDAVGGICVLLDDGE